MATARGHERRISLAAYITLPFLVVNLLFAGILGAISFLGYRASVGTVTEKYAAEISAAITSHLDSFFSSPRRIVAINAEELRSSRLDPGRVQELEEHFVAQIKNYDWISFVGIALPDGEYFGASRSPADGRLSIYEARRAGGMRLDSFEVTLDDKKGRLLNEGEVFDARDRPWYRAALENIGQRWYSVYKYASFESLGTGISVAIRAKDGSLMAVADGDVALTQVSSYLASNLPTPSTITFVVEKGGLLLASSEKEPPWSFSDNVIKRKPLDQSENPLLRTAAHLLAAGDYGPQARSFSFDSQLWHLDFRHFTDPYGLDLGVGILQPEKPFSAAFERIGLISWLLSLLAVAVMGLVGLGLSRTLAKPAVLIRDRARRLALGDWSGEPARAGPAREFVDLAASFESMADALRKNVEGLEAKVSARTSELEILLREVHHRIKNNLTIAASLLSIQASMAASKETSTALEEAHNRIQSMALLYDRLYRQPDVSKADAANYIGAVLDGLEDSLLGSRRITILRDLEASSIEAKKASSIGIIITELVTNSCKYAFPGDEGGTIEVTARREGGRFRIRVADDGAGFPPGFDLKRGAGFGLALATNLAEQLGGELVMGEPDRGVEFTVLCDA